MPRRHSVARKTKYQGAPTTRLSGRFATKLMTDGKRHLSERILREALARAEAQARRPGIEVLESAMRNATPIIEVKPRRVGGATYQVPVEIRATAAYRSAFAGSSRRPASGAARACRKSLPRNSSMP